MLKDKVFVVTGGGNGIGREVVLQLLKSDAKVAALDISEKGLLETSTLSGDNASLKTYSLDITNQEKVHETHQQITKDFGHIDGLIHVAGIIQPFVKVMDLEIKTIKKVIDVNFYGTVYLNQIFLPTLLKREKAYLVNVSSMGGFLPVPGQAVYGASKAAVKLLTEALYAELKGTNVNVTLVFPGAINTNIIKNSNVDMGKEVDSSDPKHKMMSPFDAAKEIIKAMQKKKLHAYVGTDSKIMNKLNRLAPQKSTDLIAKKMADLIK
ncbi:MAG: SDR family NAD(P)-dependent oxidoreductase [Bacilli bacterium]|jgi:short-subunit dehydrogenase|nr:SDR family NAD(P)-dependent oxidoreductase [Bacilli bacterium]